MNKKQLIAEIESLPVNERISLIEELLQTLNPPDPEVQKAWIAIEELPEDATVEQAMYKLYVLDQVNKALADTREKISQGDMEKEFLDN
jgi:hypothetical protein